jgi:hypothetical protein
VRGYGLAEMRREMLLCAPREKIFPTFPLRI